ncbi:RGCVC family protein [Actinophytocola sediminis]
MPEVTIAPQTVDSVPTDMPAAEPVDKCAACPHPRSEHDRIAARFCSATVAGDFSRGCVCSS